MANTDLEKLQQEEATAKGAFAEDVTLYKDDTVGGIGLALMGLGMGLKHQGGDFMRIVEAKKQAVNNKKRIMFEEAKSARQEREAQIEREKALALEAQRHAESMGIRQAQLGLSQMKVALGAEEKIAELIASGNTATAELYSKAVSKRVPSVGQFKAVDSGGKQVMIRFPSNVDADVITGAIKAGDPSYRLNPKTLVVERLNKADGSYAPTEWTGTLSDAYRESGVGGTTKLAKEDVALMNLSKGQTVVSALSPKLKAFANSQGLDDGAVVAYKDINKEYAKSIAAAKEREGIDKQADVIVNDVESKAGEVARRLDKAEADPYAPTTGFTGMAAKLDPSSEVSNIVAEVDKLKSVLTLENINLIRKSSKTGSTGLGATNKHEFETLQNRMQNIDPTRGTEATKRELADVVVDFKTLAYGKVPALTKDTSYLEAAAIVRRLKPSLSDEAIDAYLGKKGIVKK